MKYDSYHNSLIFIFNATCSGSTNHHWALLLQTF